MSKDLKLIRNFEQHCEQILQSTTVGRLEKPGEKEARIKRAQKDFRYFVEYYFPHYAKVPSADFHVKAANNVLRHNVLRAVFEWFRGAAKSTNCNVLIPLWLKIQPKREINVMVLVGKSQDSAKTLLSDLQAELTHNQRYINDFGEQFNFGSWEEGEFVTKDGVAFFARGRGQSPRGLRHRENRPDFIVLDDIDDDELVKNEARVDDVIEWIFDALFGAMDMGKGRFIMVGNRIHSRSVLAKMAQRLEDVKKGNKANKLSNDDITAKLLHTRVNALDENGGVTWEGRYTKEQIAEMIAFMGYRSSQKELFNNPIEEGKVFKKEWFQYKRLPPVSTYKHLIAYLDGGFKKTKTTDSKALILAGLWKGEFHIVKTYVGQATIEEMIAWHYDLDEWLKQRNATCLWYMEEVFLLDLLYDHFAAAAKKRKYQIPMIGDKRKKPDKDLRIESTAGLYERGNVWWNIAEEGSHP